MRKHGGNILFIILLAIILFVALTYAIMSQRDSSKNASGEKASTIAASIIQTGTLIENTVSRIRLTNDCAEGQISFENATVSGYTNSAAPATKRCHVFDPAGGGTSWPIPPADSGASAYYFGVTNVRGVTTNSNDLVLFLDGLSKTVCDEINKNIDRSMFTSPAFMVEDSAIVMDNAHKFTGNYTSGNADIDSTWWTFRITSMAGCRQNTAGGNYYFFHVLLGR